MRSKRGKNKNEGGTALYRKGQKIFARWKDLQYYPAIILKFKIDDIVVKFIQDNIIHTLKSHLVKPMPKKAGDIQLKNSCDEDSNSGILSSKTEYNPLKEISKEEETAKEENVIIRSIRGNKSTPSFPEPSPIAIHRSADNTCILQLPVSSLPSQRSVSSLPSQPSVSSLPSQPSVSSLPSQPSVSSLPSQRSVSSLPSQRSVSSLPSQRSVSSLPSQRSVSSLPSQPSFSSLPSQPSVSSLPSQPSVSSLPSQRSVSSLPSQRSVSSLPSQRSVSSLPSQRSVSSRPSQPSVSSLPSQPSVSSLPSQPSVSSLPSQPSVSSPSPPSLYNTSNNNSNNIMLITSTSGQRKLRKKVKPLPKKTEVIQFENLSSDDSNYDVLSSETEYKPSEEDISEEEGTDEENIIVRRISGNKSVPSFPETSPIAMHLSTENNTSRFQSPVSNLHPQPTVSSLSPSLDDASNNFHNAISVMSTSNKGQRKFDKKYFCLFCDKFVAKLPRHYESKHREQPEIAEIMALKGDNTKQDLRKKLILKLRNKGSHKWNCKVLKSGNGELSVVYRPNAEISKDPRNYIPCSKCYGYYTKNYLWKHNCPWREGTKRKHARVVAEGRSMLPLPIHVDDHEHISTLFSTMREDNITNIAKNDSVICQFMRRMHFSKGGKQDHKKGEIRNNVREIARLLKELRRRKGSESCSLESIFDPGQYKDVISAVNSAAGFNTENEEYAAPELARKLGLHIKTCAIIVQGTALAQNNKCLTERCENFLKLHEHHFFVEVGAQAKRNRNERKRNAAKLIPLSRDVVKLTTHLENISNKNLNTLKNKSISENEIKPAWIELQKSTLTHILLFNRKREGEVSRMKISDYVNRKETNISDIEGCLSKTEKALCQMFTRVEIQGKGDKNVPILLTPKMKESIEILLKLRDAVGVKKSNNYVFASCSYGADYFYRGSACLKKFAMECGASDQESLRSTKLRKQIASLSQVINLKNNELDSLAKFMGHDIRIHRQFYRLLDNIVEIAKISRLLLSLEKGNLHHQIGKGLDDIDVSLEDDAEEEEGIEHQNIEIDEELEECTEETFPESEMAASSHMLIHQSSDRTKGIPTSSTVDNTHQEKLTSPKIPSRRPWTRVEKAAVENHLLDFI